MIPAYIIASIASYLFARAGHYYLSGIVLILMAVALYLREYLRTGNIIDLRGLFCLGFLGGEGVSALKLSYLQTDWEPLTWICFFLAFMGVYLVYEILERKHADIKIRETPTDLNRLFAFTLILTGVSLLAFGAEAYILGYIPLFVRGVPHAYSYFHISGVHYFTVSAVLVPALSLIWFLNKGVKGKKAAFLIAADIAAFLIPVMCVSRFQVIFELGLAVFVYLYLRGSVRVWKIVLTAIAVMIPVMILLTVSRSHDSGYLNGIFEMKDPGIPTFLSRIYIYIANNYDNFNCLVKELPEHSLGMKILFPLWALTGLKFICPSLVDFPLYVTKEELTTVTLFYDHYYDFGVAGVFVCGGIIGAAAYFIRIITAKKKSGFAVLIYAQTAIYLALSFFTTWFSNPTTWFYYGVSVLGMIYCDTGIFKKKKS